MRVVRFSRAALDDLSEMWEYIAIGSPAAADRLTDHLTAYCLRLANAPGIGRPRPDIEPGIRGVTVKNRLIVYEIHHNAIDIHRIIHGARDLRKTRVDRGGE